MEQPSPREFFWVAASAVVLAGFVVYANSFSNKFVWDDASSVLLHKHVQDPAFFFQLFLEDQHAFGRGQGSFYRPLVSVSFMVDYALTTAVDPVAQGVSLQDGLSPLIFHLTNTAWHVLAAVLLLGVLLRFGTPRAVSLAVALLWVVHPLHTEAVTYISGRADSMAAAFMFGALLFATSPRRSAVSAVVASSVCFLGGLLSKESAMIYPALLFFAIACAPVDKTRAARWAPLAGAVIVLGAYAVVKFVFLNFPSDSPAPDTGLGERLVQMLQAFSFYLGLTVAPIGLHMERSLAGASVIFAVTGAIALIAMIACAVWAYRAERRRLAFAIAWFVVTWLPISGLFPLNAPMAEHWLYVPLAGLLWAVGELVAPFLAAKPARVAAAGVVAAWFLVLVGLSVERNRDWRNNETIFVKTLEANPNSLRVRYNLGVTYQDIDDNPIGAIREFERFLQDYSAAHQADPEWAKFYDLTAMEAGNSLGALYFQRGQLQQAAQRFGYVIDSAAGKPIGQDEATVIAEASIGLGQCFQAIGKPEAAAPHFDRAVQLRPDMAPAVDQLRRRGPQPM